jgi:hypothetical protein
MAATTQNEFGTTLNAPYARRREDVVGTKRISWGAVAAGVAVALVIQLVLNMIGAGFGFSTIDPVEGDIPSVTTFSIAGGLWMVVSSIVALFAGGWLASYLAGLTHDEDGMLHGLVTWAMSTLVLVLFLVTVFGSLLLGTLNALGIGATAAAPQAAQAATSGPIGEQDIGAFINQLMTEGNSKEALIDTVVARTNMSRAEASQAVEEAERAARVAADKTAEAFAHVLLWGALALIAGAMAAGSGGNLGTTPWRISRQRAVAGDRYTPTA